VITTIDEFRDAVAFETYVLDKMLPVLGGSENGSIDLRGGGTVASVAITITENISAGAVERVKNELAPLLFGAAWKTLDLVLEFALHSAGLQPDRNASEWSISSKKNHALKAAGDHNLLTANGQIWRAITALYANTVEHRHCLVHRTAIVDSSSGSLSGKDRSGSKLQSLSLEEQKATARIALLAAEGILNAGITPRNEDHLKFFLDQVASHTNQPLFGVTKQGAPAQILTELVVEDDKYVVDVTAAAERASKVFQGVLHFNVIFDVPDESGRRLRANLEDIPAGRIVINLDALPSWMAFV
jgi:hypothetical protein